MVLIQRLMTHWSKASRGFSGAELRNKTPLSMRVPVSAQSLSTYQTLCHSVSFDEVNDFIPSDSEIDYADLLPSNLYKCNALSLRLGNDNSIKLQFVWTVEDGAPARKGRNLGSLNSGEWARLEYNGRQGERSAWSYQKTVINIGYFEVYHSEIFQTSEPTYAYEEMAKLL